MHHILDKKVIKKILFSCTFKQAWEAGYGEDTDWEKVLEEKEIDTTDMEITVKVGNGFFQTDLIVHGTSVESEEDYHARLLKFKEYIDKIIPVEDD